MFLFAHDEQEALGLIECQNHQCIAVLTSALDSKYEMQLGKCLAASWCVVVQAVQACWRNKLEAISTKI